MSIWAKAVVRDLHQNRHSTRDFSSWSFFNPHLIRGLLAPPKSLRPQTSRPDPENASPGSIEGRIVLNSKFTPINVARASTATVQSTSAPRLITFTFTNNIGNAPVYIAIAGEEINTQANDASTYGYLAPQMTDGSPKLTSLGSSRPSAPYRMFPTTHSFPRLRPRARGKP